MAEEPKGSTAPHPQTQSRLFQIPLELRNAIYVYYSIDFAKSSLNHTSREEHPEFFYEPQKLYECPALLQSFKRLTHEARPFAYQYALVRVFCKNQVALGAAGTFKPENIRHLFVELGVEHDLAYLFTDIYSIFQGGENLDSIKFHVSPKFVVGGVQHTVVQKESWALMLSGPLVAYLKSLPKLAVVEMKDSYGELLLDHVQSRLKGKLTIRITL